MIFNGLLLNRFVHFIYFSNELGVTRDQPILFWEVNLAADQCG